MSNPKPDPCFVIMPISDSDAYDDGHFGRVYKYLIRPACEKAGYAPIRADEVQNTNYIIIDIIRRIIESPMAVCDLSARNPNVLYELGIRQAFNLPVVLLKDSRSNRIFDIQGFRTLDYDESLRVDSIERDCDKLSNAIYSTARASQDVNSLVQLLGIKAASVGKATEVSLESELILDAVRDLSSRLTKIEDVGLQSRGLLSLRSKLRSNEYEYLLPSGEKAKRGDELYDDTGKLIGFLNRVRDDKVDVASDRFISSVRVFSGDEARKLTSQTPKRAEED